VSFQSTALGPCSPLAGRDNTPGGCSDAPSQGRIDSAAVPASLLGDGSVIRVRPHGDTFPFSPGRPRAVAPEAKPAPDKPSLRGPSRGGPDRTRTAALDSRHESDVSA